MTSYLTAHFNDRESANLALLRLRRHGIVPGSVGLTELGAETGARSGPIPVSHVSAADLITGSIPMENNNGGYGGAVLLNISIDSASAATARAVVTSAGGSGIRITFS